MHRVNLRCVTNSYCNIVYIFQTASPKKYRSCREVFLRGLVTAANTKRRKFKACLEECRFGIVREVFLSEGAVEVNFNGPWELAWTDGTLPIQRFTKMRPFQRINHFPGMSEICKKDLLAMNLKRMKKVLPEHYDFFPTTFCLPDDALKLRQYNERRKNQDTIFILKPYNNCQGCGIDLVKGISNANKYKNMVCQRYIAKPFTLDGFKFDLRLYVLITSISPLRIYVYDEGLVRLATIPYKKPISSNLQERRMHLTNYAVNRCPEEGDVKSLGQCKKTLSDLENFLRDKDVHAPDLWATIDGIIVKTIMCGLPAMRHIFHTSFPTPKAVSPCFEVLGFDILLDEKLKPYLLEVNRSPSLGGSMALDKALKTKLIKNTIEMVLLSQKQVNMLNNEDHLKSVRRLTNPTVSRQLSARERIVAEYQPKQEEQRMGNFRRLYPDQGGEFEYIKRAVFDYNPCSNGRRCKSE